MRPFQEFRFWARRAPVGERVTVAIATVIVVGLIGWLLVPEGDDSEATDILASGPQVEGNASAGSPDTTVAAGDGGGTEGATAAPDAGGSDGGGTATGGGGGATGSGGTGTSGGGDATAAGSEPAAGGGCVSPPGKAKGVKDREVHVAIAITELFGPVANDIFDIPPPDVAKADFNAAIAGINAEGGIACRKLVGHFIHVNPADEAQMMGVCRNVADGDYFALVDTGSMATRQAVLTCIGQRKIPYFGAFYITDKARKDFYPYLYSFYYKEQLYKNTAFGLKELGFYDASFRKLGFVYRTCEADAIKAFRGWIRESGVADAKVVEYSLGCPSLFASESDLAQMTLTFQREGVTHVIGGNVQGDYNRITGHFEQQRYRPKWGIPDEAALSIAEGPRSPDPNNFNNALAITLARDGEQNTPGMAPTAGTHKCNAYRAAAKLRPVWEVPANAGNACDQLWMLDSALSNAPEISAPGLQVGLQRTKSIDFSYPQGPTDFTGPGVTTGGQFWRAARFLQAECRCWRLVQREFRRGF